LAGVEYEWASQYCAGKELALVEVPLVPQLEPSTVTAIKRIDCQARQPRAIRR
jgi:hypothetical protein